MAKEIEHAIVWAFNEKECVSVKENKRSKKKDKNTMGILIVFSLLINIIYTMGEYYKSENTMGYSTN